MLVSSTRILNKTPRPATARSSKMSVRAAPSSGPQAMESQIAYPPPQVFISEPAPSFSCPAVVDGDIKTVTLDDYKGKWKILFFYPKAFTYVCPTEIIAFNDRRQEFEALNCQLIAASCDSPEVNLAWTKTPRKKGGLGEMHIPIMSDMTKEVSAKYGILVKSMGVALRGLFLIDEENVVQQITINPLPLGRSVDEALRLLQAAQFFKEHGEVCPANWKPGQASMIADPKGALDYFSQQKEEGRQAAGAPAGTEEEGEEEEEEDEIAPSVPKAKSPEELTSLVQQKSQEKPLFVEFYSPTCGMCKASGPHIESMYSKLKDQVTFVKAEVSSDKMAPAKSAFGINVYPTFKVFRGGKEVSQIIGWKSGQNRDLISETLEKAAKGDI